MGAASVSAIILWVTLVVLVAIAGFLVWMLLRSIQQERRSSNVRRIWSNFALSLTFCALFFVSWIAHGFAEWGTYAMEQRDHGQSTAVDEFLIEFGQSTLENWQSEFLQLFSFVVLSALLIHRGSSESRDGTDRIEQSLKRIEKRLEEAGLSSSET